MIIDFSLSSFEFKGIGISSNSAKFNSDPGSPSGPLTGKSDSPAQESKKNRKAKDIIDFIKLILKIKPFNLKVND